MAKSLFLMLFSALMGITFSPEFLTAADDVELTRIDTSNAVETVPLPEPEPVATTAPVARQAGNVSSASPAVPANHIAVAGRTLSIVDVASTTVDSGSHINKYGANFLYGHNTAAVFGGLASMGVGSTFTVSYGGATTNYQVANVVVFEKNADGRLQLNGSGDFMNAVSRAVHYGVHYDLSLMTCSGTSYGNGDASHRLVLFANAI